MVLLELDPNVVKPGWIPLIITILLAGAMVFLYLSMRKQMRRIDAPYAADVRRRRSGPPEASAGTESADPPNAEEGRTSGHDPTANDPAGHGRR